jgi:hypothetical protein
MTTNALQAQLGMPIGSVLLAGSVSGQGRFTGRPPQLVPGLTCLRGRLAGMRPVRG